MLDRLIGIAGRLRTILENPRRIVAGTGFVAHLAALASKVVETRKERQVCGPAHGPTHHFRLLGNLLVNAAGLPGLRRIELAALQFRGPQQVGGTHFIACIARPPEHLERLLVERHGTVEVTLLEVQTALVL